MTRNTRKIELSRSAEIPFDRLQLSQSNVRRLKAGVDIEELAEDIARRTLLTSLTVRPVLDEAGQATGNYDVPAGGRRFRALELLVKQKRLPKDVPVPCIIREAGTPEEDSLAENVQRASLHPLDQYRAFAAMRERGMSEDEIAAAFFTTAAVVRQRLRLAACAPALLDAYAEDRLTLEQLMAYTVNPDHERQVQVFEMLAGSYNREPYAIRRMLTESSVRASDKRVRFVGFDAYEAAGGTVLRDLFQADDGGYLDNVGLLDQLVATKLRAEADAIADEGWRWVEAEVDQPYGITYGLRRLYGERVPLSDEEAARREALVDKLARIEADNAGDDELSDEISERYDAISAELAELDVPRIAYAAEDRALAGVFVSIGTDGALKVDRGYVRAEDEPQVADVDVASVVDQLADDETGDPLPSGPIVTRDDEPEDDDPAKPLSDRLVQELTAFRTVALREAIGREPEVAQLVALHAFALKLFYHYAQDSCAELSVTSASFGNVTAPGLAESAPAIALDARHEAWAEQLGGDPAGLWDRLGSLDAETRDLLFAHCVAMSVNAVVEPWNKRPRAIAHADQLAGVVSLDLRDSWTPTADSYLGRVTKSQIVSAVREACGPEAIDHLAGRKKADMVATAEAWLAGRGWLPVPLRSPGYTVRSTAMPGEPDGDDVVSEIAPAEADGTLTHDGTEAHDIDESVEDEVEHLAA